MELAAMTGGRSSLEAPFFRSQLDLCLTQGEVFVAEQAGGIIGVLFVYAPGQDFVQEYVVYLVLRQPPFSYSRRNDTISQPEQSLYTVARLCVEAHRRDAAMVDRPCKMRLIIGVSITTDASSRDLAAAEVPRIDGARAR